MHREVTPVSFYLILAQFKPKGVYFPSSVLVKFIAKNICTIYACQNVIYNFTLMLTYKHTNCY
jgi:hypothetical protein